MDLEACARAYAAPAAWADPLVSPLRAAHSGLPPLLIQAGTDELLAPDASVIVAAPPAPPVPEEPMLPPLPPVACA